MLEPESSLSSSQALGGLGHSCWSSGWLVASRVRCGGGGCALGRGGAGGRCRRRSRLGTIDVHLALAPSILTMQTPARHPVRLHPLTSSRHHPPAAAATTTSWLSFGFQRPHLPNFELFWSAAVAAAGLGCLSRRVCAVKPKDVVNAFGRCRPMKTRRRLRVCQKLCGS